MPDFLTDMEGWVTAIATVTLAFLTFVLAFATIRMAKIMSSPAVIVNLEINQWSLMHIDLVVQNCGNAPAYNVSLDCKPNPKADEIKKEAGLPLSNISILRPGQKISCYFSDFDSISDSSFDISIKWKNSPRSLFSKSISYNLDMSFYKKMTILGKMSPSHQIAYDLKKIREDFRRIITTRGSIKIDLHDKK